LVFFSERYHRTADDLQVVQVCFQMSLLVYLFTVNFSTPTNYSITTSTGVLRGHLHKEHYDQYVSECDKQGWVAKMPNQKNAGKTNAVRRIPFTMDNFRSAMVALIVANDLVCT
jgi:hypothetical protein